jgi:NAD(P)-dependent dehydrogenase (short-subunit alcohol dehydrogenase family)
MHIFIAGAGGAVGRSLVPLLITRGHTVTGTTRSPAKADALRRLGASSVILDGLDGPAVLDAVAAAQPDVIVHQMTALSNMDDLRHFEQVFALEQDLAVGDLVTGLAGDDVGEGRLAGAVRPHDRVDLALVHGQRQPVEDLTLLNTNLQVFHFKQSHYLVSIYLLILRSAAGASRRIEATIFPYPSFETAAYTASSG